MLVVEGGAEGQLVVTGGPNKTEDFDGVLPP